MNPYRQVVEWLSPKKEAPAPKVDNPLKDWSLSELERMRVSTHMHIANMRINERMADPRFASFFDNPVRREYLAEQEAYARAFEEELERRGVPSLRRRP